MSLTRPMLKEKLPLLKREVPLRASYSPLEQWAGYPQGRLHPDKLVNGKPKELLAPRNQMRFSIKSCARVAKGKRVTPAWQLNLTPLSMGHWLYYGLWKHGNARKHGSLDSSAMISEKPRDQSTCGRGVPERWHGEDRSPQSQCIRLTK